MDRTAPSELKSSIPPDDPQRQLSIVSPDDSGVRHIGLVGDTYTILLSGKETAGRYCLLDMHVPHCVCTPAGAEDFFMALGAPVATRDSPAPDKSDKEKEEWVKRADALALQYRMELLKP